MRRSLPCPHIPHGIHVIPGGFHPFHMEYVLAGIPLILANPFHFYSIWNPSGMAIFHHHSIIPYGMSMWIPPPFHGINLEWSWLPHGFHLIPCGMMELAHLLVSYHPSLFLLPPHPYQVHSQFKSGQDMEAPHPVALPPLVHQPFPRTTPFSTPLPLCVLVFFPHFMDYVVYLIK
jgi:hypothetical protein